MGKKVIVMLIVLMLMISSQAVAQNKQQEEKLQASISETVKGKECGKCKLGKQQGMVLTGFIFTLMGFVVFLGQKR